MDGNFDLWYIECFKKKSKKKKTSFFFLKEVEPH